MPSQQSKPSNSQRNFNFAKIRSLNKAIVTAFQEKDNGFDLQQAQRTLKDHFAEAEQMTMYLVDHLPEDVTEDFLINCFTDLQDEIDETVKKFKQMLKETNQHTDPVEPSQIQQPCSHNQPTTHDNLPSTSALSHLPDSLENQLTHQNTSSSQQPSFKSAASFNITNVTTKDKNRSFHRRSHEWNTWHGLFTTMIDKQPLSVAEKMTHLQMMTTGKAHEAIEGFSCNPDLYPSAMEELKRRLDTQISLLATSLPNYRHKDHPRHTTRTPSWNFQPF